MLTENDVVDAVVEYLEEKEFHIASKCLTSQRGVDIVAEQLQTKKRLLVEAKGGTSSQKGTANFGNPFTPNQVKTHVSVAFYQAAMLIQQHATEATQVVLAFPDDKAHRQRVMGIATALETLGICVFWVDDKRRVTVGINS